MDAIIGLHRRMIVLKIYSPIFSAMMYIVDFMKEWLIANVYMACQYDLYQNNNIFFDIYPSLSDVNSKIKHSLRDFCISILSSWFKSVLQDLSFVKLFDREYQIPVLSPYDIAVFDTETAEQLRIKVSVVLRMRVATDEVPNINSLNGVVVEI